MQLPSRPRRNRSTATLRESLTESRLHPSQMVMPLFVMDGASVKQKIDSMPGQFRHGMDSCLREIEDCMNLGVKSFALFPAIDEQKKDPFAKESLNPSGLYPNFIRAIKEKFPESHLYTDVAMDPYSSDGHDGVVKGGKILNDETLEILAAMAVVQAQAGADFVAPSDMMDGRVGAIRTVLDERGFQNVGILSYAAKYASSFYGPFRDALESAPKSGDKKTYQMNPANWREAIREIELDEAEGADILMVKPAMSYLDIICRVKDHCRLPIAAYHVSGEYSSIMAAAEMGWLDEKSAMMEALLSIKRSGADIIFTYYAKKAAEILRSS